ncbi:hypothetical protein FACS1894180_5880 [Bacteroidia bacterium]|nr:hypothetical protein FACS1894180_5880 [Bacteroidia bacterium]
MVRENSSTWQPYYIGRDYLGSITHVISAGGAVQQELSYDAWGNLRDPKNHDLLSQDHQPDLFLGRGYTGHEHLAFCGLINMNARLYEPAVGRFLSPDPYIQDATNTQNYNRYTYCLNNPLKYTDPSGEIVWFVVPIIYFVVYAGIEYGTQVYHNYQASKQMEALGYDPMSKKDMWFGRIDFFDVAFNGVGGAVSALVPVAAPWIMYGTPVITNAFNWYGDGTTQNVFDGSIPLGQYAFNTISEEVSLYATNVIKTGLATSQKDICNPANHTKYFSKEILGKQITGRSIEDVIQQGVASWADYSIKATKYPEFNPDRLYKDGLPVFPQTPNIPNPPILPPYNPEFPRYNKVWGNNRNNTGTINNDLEKYLRLTLRPVK